MQFADAVGAAGVGRQKRRPALVAGGFAHLFPQLHSRFGVEAGACCNLQTHQVGIAFVAAAEFQTEQLTAQVGCQVAHVSQAQQLRTQAQAQVGGLAFGHAGAGMLAQRVRHFVAHDHGHFIVAQAQFFQYASVESNLAARHAEGVDLLAADQVHLPAPVAGALVPGNGIRHQLRGNAAQALQLGVCGGCQHTLRLGFGQQLVVLLRGSGFQGVGRHQVAQTGGIAHVHLRQRSAGQGDSAHRCSGAHQLQKAAPACPRAGGGVQGLHGRIGAVVRRVRRAEKTHLPIIGTKDLFSHVRQIRQRGCAFHPAC